MTVKIEFMGVGKKRFLLPNDNNTVIAAITVTPRSFLRARK